MNILNRKTTMKRTTLGKIRLVSLQVAAALWISGCATPTQVASDKPVFPSPPDEARFYYEGTLASSADVEKEDKNANLRRMLTGEGKSGEGLAKPYGIAVYHGRVFVSDTVARMVKVFDIPGQRFYKIGEDEGGALGRPIGLDVDGKGQLYVVDALGKIVKMYDKDGKYVRTLGDPSMFNRPSGIAVDAEGSRIYVVDTGGVSTQDHRVRVLDAQSGAHLLDIGKRGSAPGELNLPVDATIGVDGLLYVVDSGNFRVQAFRTDGTFVRTFGKLGAQGGAFSRPKEIATDPAGNIYVVDAAFGNFQIFTPEGQLLMAVGNRSERNGMAKFMLPSGIAIDGDGRIYMSDQFFRKVDVFRPASLAEGEGFTSRKTFTDAAKDKETETDK